MEIKILEETGRQFCNCEIRFNSDEIVVQDIVQKIKELREAIKKEFGEKAEEPASEAQLNFLRRLIDEKKISMVDVLNEYNCSKLPLLTKTQATDAINRLKAVKN